MLPPLGTSLPLRRGFFVRVGSDFRQKPTVRLGVGVAGLPPPRQAHNDGSTKLSPAFWRGFFCVRAVRNHGAGLLVGPPSRSCQRSSVKVLSGRQAYPLRRIPHGNSARSHNAMRMSAGLKPNGTASSAAYIKGKTDRHNLPCGVGSDIDSSRMTLRAWHAKYFGPARPPIAPPRDRASLRQTSQSDEG